MKEEMKEFFDNAGIKEYVIIDEICFVNMTEDKIKVDGKIFPPSGAVIREYITFTELRNIGGFEISTITRGEVQGLPSKFPGVYYIISEVLAEKIARADVIAPVTSFPGDIINKDGNKISISGFLSFNE